MPKDKTAKSTVPAKSAVATPAADAKGAKAGAGAKAAAASKVVANPRVVEAFRAYRDAKDQAKTALVDLAKIAQNEQCSRPELVASYIEAYGVEKSTAEGQVSRMIKLLTNKEVLEKLESGEIDLKTAREKTVKKQLNPSADKKKENVEKRFAKGISAIVEAAKDGAMDFASVVAAVKAALKKAGV